MPDAFPPGGSPRLPQTRPFGPPSTPSRDHAWALAWLEFGRQLTPAERAQIVKGMRPELTDREVASRAGVSAHTLYRFGAYMAVKARHARPNPSSPHYRGRERRRIDPPDGGWGFSSPFDADA